MSEETTAVTHPLTDRKIAADGSIEGYRASRTLPIRVELARQLRRKRTQVTLGLLAVLPIVLLIAFELGASQNARRSGGLVDLATASGQNFVMFALFASASFLLVVVVALFFGDTVASEASWSSLKYLLAIPVPRGRLLRQKAIVSGLLAVAGLIVLPGMALIVGLIFYGGGDMVTPTGESVALSDGLTALALAMVYLMIHLFWVAGLALYLSVSTDAPLSAVGGAALVSIVSQILDQITDLGSLRNYLPTHYSFAWSDLLSTDIDWTGMASGVLSALVYGTVFLLLAARRFATKDITS
ncbi:MULTISPECIES: ABC transporter permease [unclassified Crossiella]|uniref:ABC transporter permease n=1 Tax=unclassified Crossiella TaxID=2620835 RepID=UPI001FFE368E|nr:MULTISPECIES: ABC transporter permease [unclassified Crossiella]MCK2239681.1 ABC transporter permease [Crossiella sp. S99.2]MCK2252376.1 ABC transporter permease [Crossiella sp. S99.1]